MTERTTRFLGLDVHKATIAVAVAEANRRQSLTSVTTREPPLDWSFQIRAAVSGPARPDPSAGWRQ